ncbi:MAG TPA: prolyl aminopeptidase [Alphaproteobacteria bacterium]|nr:prolyl aminopeptidase [Alphaproteobacteria bacterium]
MKRRDLFPPIEPYQTGWLKVDDIHSLYWETSGNPQGVPIVFVHGGPGAGTQTVHRRFFDPRRWHIILFDQRGAGRSEPHGDVRNNTTAHLVEDMEKLRQHLGVARWHLFGGSWGSTLSLAYAEAHPERCLCLILRGICLMEPHEIDWFLYGLRAVFPDAWESFASVVPPDQRHDLLNAYIRLMEDPNPDIRNRACMAWSGYESACSTLLPHPEHSLMHEDTRRALGIARLEAHYFKHNLFQPETALCDNIDRIRSIPAIIVHGRYDMICPVANAWKLHKLWPEAELAIIPDAGHAALEPGIRDRLIEATERFKDIAG